MANEHLAAAKRGKNDEFYTQYRDIEREMQAYIDYNPDVFRGKTILLPCDDPERSEFTRYFAQRFTPLGLKRLISTSYAPGATANPPPQELAPCALTAIKALRVAKSSSSTIAGGATCSATISRATATSAAVRSAA